MDIVGKVIIEKHRDGILIERRETKNVIRNRGAELFSWYGWSGVDRGDYRPFAPGNWFYFVTRLVLAKEDKTTIKYIDTPNLSRANDPANMRWKVGLSWTDASADAYTVYYIGLMWAYETPTVGADNITGSPSSCFAAKIDPPMSKASGDTLTITWEISIPYGEVP